jgi:hypothetical protein
MVHDHEETQDALAADLLIGAEKIARELGLSQTAVYYLSRKQRLPIGKLGRNLIASRKQLRRAVMALAS